MFSFFLKLAYAWRTVFLKLKCGSAIHLEHFQRLGQGTCVNVHDGGVARFSKIGTARNVLISCRGGDLAIGNSVSFNNNCYVVCHGTMKIGDGCLFGPNVCIVDHDHKFNEYGVTAGFKVGTVKIGRNCWVGANATILRDTELGDGCIVGAGVVVKGKFAPHSLIVTKRELSICQI